MYLFGLLHLELDQKLMKRLIHAVALFYMILSIILSLEKLSKREPTGLSQWQPVPADMLDLNHPLLLFKKSENGSRGHYCFQAPSQQDELCLLHS